MSNYLIHNVANVDTKFFDSNKTPNLAYELAPYILNLKQTEDFARDLYDELVEYENVPFHDKNKLANCLM